MSGESSCWAGWELCLVGFSPSLLCGADFSPPSNSLIPCSSFCFISVSMPQSDRSTLRCSYLWIFIRFPLHELFALFSYREKSKVGMYATKSSHKKFHIHFYVLIYFEKSKKKLDIYSSFVVCTIYLIRVC